ncbi:MAG: hypothetical protein ACREE4_19240 [Stellaceae bacterium]
MITIDETRIGHIFRDAEGHFAEDTALNRQALLDTANRPGNLVGADRFGNAWFAETRADGSQIWAQVRGGKITNGGINPRPRNFDL